MRRRSETGSRPAAGWVTAASLPYEQAGRVANVGWNRWTPVNAAAIGALLVGSIGQLGSNADRVAGQKGVASMSLVKTALTAAAMGATAYSRLLGRKLAQAGDVPAEE